MATPLPDRKALYHDQAAAIAAVAEPQLIAPCQALREEDTVLE
jgi:hypothetical protein